MAKITKQEQAMNDLLPCPFCGRDATYIANYWKNVPRVRCSDPEGNCPGFSGGHPNEWNTRTPPPGYALVKLEGAEEKQRWRDDMENAPHNCSVLLGWRDWRDGRWCMEVGAASTGRRVGDSSSVSRHGSATHWMHLPAAPKETVDGDEL